VPVPKKALKSATFWVQNQTYQLGKQCCSSIPDKANALQFACTSIKEKNVIRAYPLVN
jgi:hypothetical protein